LLGGLLPFARPGDGQLHHNRSSHQHSDFADPGIPTNRDAFITGQGTDRSIAADTRSPASPRAVGGHNRTPI